MVGGEGENYLASLSDHRFLVTMNLEPPSNQLIFFCFANYIILLVLNLVSLSVSFSFYKMWGWGIGSVCV